MYIMKKRDKKFARGLERLMICVPYMYIFHHGLSGKVLGMAMAFGR